MNLIVIDTETGGLNPEFHSVVSVAIVLWRNRELIAETQVFVNEPELNLDTDRSEERRVGKECRL